MPQYNDGDKDDEDDDEEAGDSGMRGGNEEESNEESRGAEDDGEEQEEDEEQEEEEDPPESSEEKVDSDFQQLNRSSQGGEQPSWPLIGPQRHSLPPNLINQFSLFYEPFKLQMLRVLVTVKGSLGASPNTKTLALQCLPVIYYKVNKYFLLTVKQSEYCGITGNSITIIS